MSYTDRDPDWLDFSIIIGLLVGLACIAASTSLN
jgi:hypothetical protein